MASGVIPEHWPSPVRYRLGCSSATGSSAATELPNHAVDPPDPKGRDHSEDPRGHRRLRQVAVEVIDRHAGGEDRDHDHPSWSAHSRKATQGSFRNTGPGERRAPIIGIRNATGPPAVTQSYATGMKRGRPQVCPGPARRFLDDT